MDANKIRPVTLWVVNYGNGNIDPNSIRRTRREAIEAFLYDPAMPGWDHWRSQGCRAVKVLVSTPEAKA